MGRSEWTGILTTQTVTDLQSTFRAIQEPVYCGKSRKKLETEEQPLLVETENRHRSWGEEKKNAGLVYRGDLSPTEHSTRIKMPLGRVRKGA